MDAIRKHITDAISSIPAPAPPPAPTPYRDALMNDDLGGRPPFPPHSLGYNLAAHDLDPRQKAREASRAKQILVDFTELQDREKMRKTSLTTLIEDANLALTHAFPDSSASFVHAQKLAHGGLLLELNSLDATGLFGDRAAKEAFLKGLGGSATIRPRHYNVVVYFVPLSFKAGDPDDMREIEAANALEPNSIVATRWIKPVNRRLPHQTVAHAIFSFADPKTANKVIAEQLVVCQKKLDAVKSKREPVHCMKCQQWGHFASSCESPHDQCGNCGEQHRTNDCNSPGRFCVPCGIDGHPSWDHECPTFNTRSREMDQRTPDNQLTYFPTEEPWTRQAANAPWNFFTNLHTHRHATRFDAQAPRPSRPLIERVGPPHKPPRQPRGARGPLTTLDPSLPTADGDALDEPLPQPESQHDSSRGFPRPRTGNHPDARIKASGRGKARGRTHGTSRSIQMRLDDFQYRPLLQTPGAGPSRISTLSQDITALITPSPNSFAPIAPPDLDSAHDPSPNIQSLPPSSDPPLSPAPSHPRDFPDLSPAQSWNDPDPHPPQAPSPIEDPNDSDDDVSFSSHV